MPKQFKIGAFDANGEPFIIPDSDIHNIEAILWKSSVLLFPTELSARLRRSLVANAHTKESGQRHILMDRNIVSDIINSFKKDEIDQKSREIAVAVLLFMRLDKFLPAALPALQEFESAHPVEVAYTDSTTFGKVASVPIERYLDLLNGRSSQLLEQDVPSTLKFPPLDPQTSPLQMSVQWMVSYLPILQMVFLERDETLTGRKRMELFLEWVFKDFAFNPPLLLVASQFFGQRRDGSIIKKSRTPDLVRLAREVKNSAWDLNVLLEWHLRVKRKEFCVLASLDDALRNIAVRLRKVRTALTRHERLLLQEDWPKRKDAEDIYNIMLKYSADLESPTRHANRGLTPEYYKMLKDSLEHQLGIHGMVP